MYFFFTPRFIFGAITGRCPGDAPTSRLNRVPSQGPKPSKWQKQNLPFLPRHWSKLTLLSCAFKSQFPVFDTIKLLHKSPKTQVLNRMITDKKDSSVLVTSSLISYTAKLVKIYLCLRNLSPFLYFSSLFSFFLLSQNTVLEGSLTIKLKLSKSLFGIF